MSSPSPSLSFPYHQRNRQTASGVRRHVALVIWCLGWTCRYLGDCHFTAYVLWRLRVRHLEIVGCRNSLSLVLSGLLICLAAAIVKVERGAFAIQGFYPIVR